MLKVGITGGIGSGKSVVCAIFSSLGIPVYNADNVARDLVDTDEKIKSKIKKEFGNDLYDASGKLDRKRMSALVFNNEPALAKLNGIVHPAVMRHSEEWIKQHKESLYIVRETAILFESGTYKDLDKIITVTAPEEIRIKHVMERDKKSKEEILAVIKNQSSDREKIKKSDFVIINDERKLVLPQVLAIHEKLCADVSASGR